MQDADLFMELAGIAGVFVGFGALIAVRSAGASGALEVAYTRGVVLMGLLAVAAALAPVTFGRYDLDEHQVLTLSGVVLMIGIGALFAVMSRTPEWTLADEELDWPSWLVLASTAGFMLWLVATLLIPAVIVLGVAPDLEAALYFTDVVLILSWTAMLLLLLVLRGRRPATA